MPSAEPYGVFRAKGILFGDDYWGTVLDEKTATKNKRGIWMKQYLVVPSPQLIKMYPVLKERGVLTYKDYALWVEYPMYWVCDENPSRTSAIARIFCTFDGKETPMTKRFDKYTEEIKLLEIELENVKIANMQLLEENGHLLGEMNSLIKRYKELEEIMKTGKTEKGEDDVPGAEIE